MNDLIADEALILGPVSPDWTIAEMLSWIGADDARCHDERLVGALDAVCRALDPGAVPLTGRVVALVRQLAMQVSMRPGSGERTVGEVVGVRTGSARDAGVLVGV